MATREQCEERLRAKFSSKESVQEFLDDWGGSGVINNWTDEEFINENIKWILDQAQRRDHLDLLGVKLGIGTDSEQRRVVAEIAAKAATSSAEHAKEANGIAKAARLRSWLAIAIALAALLWQIQGACGLIEK
jgi:hypothetical protein